MKLGILSDTHLHRLTDEFRWLVSTYLDDVDAILHAGDIVSAEIVTYLDRYPFYGVHGNMDPTQVRKLLPPKRVVEFPPYRLGLTHGWGSPQGLEDRIAGAFSDVDVIVYGHSHIPANHVRHGVLFFNPGTATGYSAEGTHSVGILELGDTIEGRIVNV